MYNHISYDREFVDLFMYLKGKYPKDLFNLEGIGEQLDIGKFSRNFFLSKSIADISVDSNSNVDEQTVKAYESELPKPYFRLNSIYLIWKYLRRIYNTEVANEFFEKQLTGDIYVNDLHGVQSPYSYFADTLIHVRINGNTKMIKMKKLYEYFEENSYNIENSEEITEFYNIEKYNIIKNNDIEILDKGNKWIKLVRILKHKRHNDLLVVETKNGHRTIVTEDHPVILEDGTNKLAKDLLSSDKIMLAEDIIHIFENKYTINKRLGYIIGFILGDGNVNYNSIGITQKEFLNSNIIKYLDELKFNYTIRNNSKFGKEGCDRLTIFDKKFVDFCNNVLEIDKYSYAKNIPVNIFQYNKEFAIGIIEGLIDSDGSIHPTDGRVSIRVNSFSIVQGVKEILKACGIISTIRGCKVPKIGNTYRQQYEIFSVNFRLTDNELKMFDISEKINSNKKLIIIEKGKDGRYETNNLHVLRKLTGKHDNLYDEFVYDITTETGTFYSQGMIQHNCFNFSTFDIMAFGLPFVTKIESKPPKHLSSFIGQLIHFTVYASNSTLGAVGLADILIVASYYVNKLLKEDPDISDEYKWRQVKQELQSFIFSCNQPFRGGIQSGFYNISVYDDMFLEKMCSEYIFPDGSSPDKQLIKKLQNLYLDLMNDTLRVTPATFPIVTACFAVDDNKEIIDTKFLTMISKKNCEFGFIYIYAGKTSTLSSCCRLRSDTKNEYFNQFGAGGTKIGCYDNKTEVLTSNGWKLFKDVSKDNDNILTMNDKRDISFESIEEYHEYDYNGELLNFNSKSCDLMVTPNHRMLIKSGNSKDYGYTVVLAENLKQQIISFPTSKPIINKEQDVFILDKMVIKNHIYNEKQINMELWAQFIGLYLSEGSTNSLANATYKNHQGYRIVISQSDINEDNCRYIENILDKLPWKYNKYGVNYVLFDKALWEYLKQFGNCYEKFIPDNIKYNSPNIINKCWEALVLGDGTITKNGVERYWTTSEQLKDDIQEMLLYAGYRTNCINRYPKRTAYIKGRLIKSSKICYEVIKLIRNSTSVRYDKIKKIDYNDKVYCLTVPNNTMCTRRNGKITWSGNSLGVVTINIPRIALKSEQDQDKFFIRLKEIVNLAIRVNNVKRHILTKRIDDGRAPLYDKGFMNLGKQYSTTGVVGLNESCEIMGYSILEENGQQFISDIIDEINKLSDSASKRYNAPHNCEQVPAENSAIKIAKKDIILGYQDKWELYSNQFIPLTINADLLDRIRLQGLFDERMTGGAVAHLNVETKITDSKLIEKLIKVAVKRGVVYHAINYNIQRCENGHMTVGIGENCSTCDGVIVDNFTRVVGFLTNVKNWHKVRREEDYPVRKWYGKDIV